MFRFSRYHRADEPERELLSRAADWTSLPDFDELDAAMLQDVSQREGIDFATALLYDRLRCSPRHGRLITEVDKRLRDNNLFTSMNDVDVLVVPGAFHVQRPETGADGRRVVEAARRLGCRANVINVPGFGSPADNANIIARALTDERGSGRRRAIVSLSKGSLDVLHALAASGEEVWRDVNCWISFSGLATGSPLVGWLRRRPWRLAGVRLLFAWHGLPYRVLGEIDRDAVFGAKHWSILAETRFKTLPIIHVVGFPLRRHLSCPLARRGHRRLAPLGPNDGGVLLADVCQLPGMIYPVWGADHYLKLPEADAGTIFAAVLAHVVSPESRTMARHVARRRIRSNGRAI